VDKSAIEQVGQPEWKAEVKAQKPRLVREDLNLTGAEATGLEEGGKPTS